MSQVWRQRFNSAQTRTPNIVSALQMHDEMTLGAGSKAVTELAAGFGILNRFPFKL